MIQRNKSISNCLARSILNISKSPAIWQCLILFLFFLLKNRAREEILTKNYCWDSCKRFLFARYKFICYSSAHKARIITAFFMDISDLFCGWPQLPLNTENTKKNISICKLKICHKIEKKTWTEKNNWSPIVVWMRRQNKMVL